MKMEQPYFSIIVPTRNRPRFLRLCLESIKKQSFQNYEVIISDNHTGNSSKFIIDSLQDNRFKYFNPPYPLPMHENWEYGLRQSNGKFILFLIDKTLLYKNALQIIFDFTNKSSIDIITWWADSFFPVNEEKSLDLGVFSPCSIPFIKPQKYCPKEEIIVRYELNCPRGMEANHYYRGKICFGAYNRILIEKITQNQNRLFFPISPDYTSMLAALSYANSAVDIGQPLLIQICSELSNGRLCQLHPESAKKFLLEIDKTGEIISSLPIPNIYSSQHNIVAFDYLEMQRVVGKDFPKVTINKRNLFCRAWGDIQNIEEDEKLKERYLSELFLEINKLKYLDKMFIFTLIYQELFKKIFSTKKLKLKRFVFDIYMILPRSIKQNIKLLLSLILRVDSWDKVSGLINSHGILPILSFSLKKKKIESINIISNDPTSLSEILEKLIENPLINESIISND
jgi:glycosyltransferase involved in cell wall biosynthesis